MNALDLKDSSVLWARNPAEELIDKHVMIDGQWVKRPFILSRGPDGLSDRPAEQENDRAHK